MLRPPGCSASARRSTSRSTRRSATRWPRENGYTSQLGYQLYDTTGATEDWTYPATGGLGFTFEIGPNNFHPPFADTVAEYEGTAPAAGAGKGGNREAYFEALENTAATVEALADHGQGARGRAPAPEEDLQDGHVAGRERRGRQGRRCGSSTTRSTRSWTSPRARSSYSLAHQPLHAPDRGQGPGPRAHRRADEPADRQHRQPAAAAALPDLLRGRCRVVRRRRVRRPGVHRAGEQRRASTTGSRTSGSTGPIRTTTTTSRSTGATPAATRSAIRSAARRTAAPTREQTSIGPDPDAGQVRRPRDQLRLGRGL